MRLIDCEPLIEFCKEVVAQEWNHKTAPISWAYAEQEFMDRLEEAPTLAAIPPCPSDCRWKGNRPQKCSCCRRNWNMKDNYEKED